jgi:hypothetical protein
MTKVSTTSSADTTATLGRRSPVPARTPSSDRAGKDNAKCRRQLRSRRPCPRNVRGLARDERQQMTTGSIRMSRARSVPSRHMSGGTCGEMAISSTVGFALDCPRYCPIRLRCGRSPRLAGPWPGQSRGPSRSPTPLGERAPSPEFFATIYDMGPERVRTFSSLELPSKRLGVLRYGPTLAFVTNFRPVLMSASPDRPPEIL